MNTTRCQRADRDELAAGYVAQTLHAAQAEDYELHLLTCADCRAAVKEAAELRAAMRTRLRRSRAVLVAPLGLASAAVVAWLILAPSALQDLGRVSAAPSLTIMPVRADLDAAAQHAQAGVTAYNQRDYRAAARSLTLAYANQPDAATAFFLGASWLMSGQPDSAISALRDVNELSPYGGEADFYAAKAFLQLEQRDSARARLERAAQHGELRARAVALRDSIDRVR